MARLAVPLSAAGVLSTPCSTGNPSRVLLVVEMTLRALLDERASLTGQVSRVEVVSGSLRDEMPGVAAPAVSTLPPTRAREIQVVAGVVEMKPLGNRADPIHVGEDVSGIAFPLHDHLAIPDAGRRQSPWPTAIWPSRSIDPCPEMLGKVNHSLSHEVILVDTSDIHPVRTMLPERPRKNETTSEAARLRCPPSVSGHKTRTRLRRPAPGDSRSPCGGS